MKMLPGCASSPKTPLQPTSCGTPKTLRPPIPPTPTATSSSSKHHFPLPECCKFDSSRGLTAPVIFGKLYFSLSLGHGLVASDGMIRQNVNSSLKQVLWVFFHPSDNVSSLELREL